MYWNISTPIIRINVTNEALRCWKAGKRISVENLVIREMGSKKKAKVLPSKAIMLIVNRSTYFNP
jgi:hypothetical protein